MADLIENEIVQGDCNEIIKEIPENSVDMIFTDPPYFISNEVVITRGRNKMKFKGPDIIQDFGDWDKFDSLGSYFKWTFKWVDLAVRVLRDGGMFCSYFDRDKINFLSRYLQDKYGFKCKGYYADAKSNPVPQARKVKWMNGWEEIGLWQKSGGKLTYNYQLGQHKDYGIRPIVSGKERLKHPTQKPESTIKDFILYWSNEGDLILDPFSGVGSVAVVCKKLNRRYIGIEQSEEYCEMAKDRLRNTEKPLF